MPSFRITSIFWAFAVMASAVVALGPLGILLALVTVAFWTRVFHPTPIPKLEWAVMLVLIVLLVGLVLPTVQKSRESLRRTACLNNLSQIGQALMVHVRQHGSLPGAASSQAPDLPPRSWRLMLLPFLDEQPLYQAYRHDQPWNAPKNLNLAQLTQFDMCRCPSERSASSGGLACSYFAVVGPQAAFLPDQERDRRDFTDAKQHTIMLVEYGGRGVPWLKPEDLSFKKTMDLLTAPPASALLHAAPRQVGLLERDEMHQVVHVLFADGRCGSLTVPISRELATALLTINGGEPIDEAELDRAFIPQFAYEKLYALVMFGVLALLPLGRLVRRWAQARVLVSS
jgi:type II secretory pathway pseudopilin PulG